MLKWDHLHIEPSSICTLKCPRCPRVEVPESLLNKQLDLDFFQQRIGANILKQIRKITFCGNDGDPIYCKDFLQILQWIKQTNPAIHNVVITNGNHKTVDWWQQLSQILDHNDELHFSIDGLENTNAHYRVNSDWTSLIQGIQTFTSRNQSTYLIWATIAFRFNQDNLLQLQQQAKQWKFDSFQLTKSTKFGSKYPAAYGQFDFMEPTDNSLVAVGHRFERTLTALTTKPRPAQELKQIFLKRSQQLGQYSGLCLIGNKGVFVNSQGELYPCCWTANRYAHNQNWLGRFNLHTRTFQDIIKDKFWTTDFLKFDSLECTTKCTKQRLTDLEHVTEW